MEDCSEGETSRPRFASVGQERIPRLAVECLAWLCKKKDNRTYPNEIAIAVAFGKESSRHFFPMSHLIQAIVENSSFDRFITRRIQDFDIEKFVEYRYS